MKVLYTIGLLILSNIFMTLAWYSHLKFVQWNIFTKVGLFGIAVISWAIAFFEYMAQVPANKIGYAGNGGPFDIWQLKVLQEVIALSVFTIFALLVFRSEPFRLNHLIGFVLLVLAVYFLFKK